MKNIFISEGKFTLFGVAFFVVSGFFVVYLSVEFVPWKLGKFLGLCLGLAIAVSCPSVRNTFPVGIQAPFFQTSASLGWFLMAWLGLLVLRCACFLRKCWHLRRLPPCPVRTVALEVF